MPPHITRTLAALAAAVGLAAAPTAPAHAVDDPLLPEQWALTDPGATGAQEAWTQSHGDGVVVAVLDTGVQLSHPELAGNLWRNPDEVPANGRDDDDNGYVDDVHGANVMTGNGSVDDDEGHGTHVAGIVAARAGNGVGGSGIAPNARIMVVKVLDANRAGDTSLLATGIRYAIDEGARILNVSINGDGTDPSLDEALAYATAQGATIVASAGNQARDIDLRPSYPASSTEPSVLTVTADEQSGDLLSVANHGLRSVELSAPGQTILSTARGSGYELRAGTSMAAPFVAGSLALLAAARPDLSQAAARDALLATAGRPKLLLGLLSAGRLDVGAAMHRILGTSWRAAGAPAQTLQLALRARTGVRAGRAAKLTWTSTGTQPVARWRVLLDGRRVATLRAGAAKVVRRRVARGGRHRWKVVALDAAGRRVGVAARTFRVLPRR